MQTAVSYRTQSTVEAQNPRFKAVIQELLEGLTNEQAATRCGGRPSAPTIRRMRQFGQVASVEILKHFGEAFQEDLCRLYAAEIAALYGTCDGDTAGTWLCMIGGRLSPPRHPRAAPPRP